MPGFAAGFQAGDAAMRGIIAWLYPYLVPALPIEDACQGILDSSVEGMKGMEAGSKA